MSIAAFAAVSLLLAAGNPFARERAEAVATGATVADLAEADRLAARAARAPDRLGAKLLREARWALPVKPPERGEHVVRVLGGDRLRHAGRVNALAFASPSRLVSCSSDGSARAWNLGNGREVRAYRSHPKEGADVINVTDVFAVSAVAAGPGNLVASAGGSQIHLWNALTGKRVRTIKSSPGATRGLAFASDGQTLYAAGDDGQLAAYSVATGEAVGVPAVAVGSRLESLAIDPAGKFAAVGTARGELYAYPLARSGAVSQRILGVSVAGNESGVLAVAFVPGSTNVLTGARDGSVKLNAITSAGGGPSAVIKSFPLHPGRVQALVVLPGGSRFATGSSDGGVRIWDLASGELKALFPLTEPAAPDADGGVTALALAPDGSELAAGTFDGAIKLLPLGAEDAGVTAADAASPVWALARGPGGRIAAAGADKAIRLYDPASGKLEVTLPGLPGAVSAITFADAETLLIGGAEQRLTRIALPQGTPTLGATHAGTVLAVAADSLNKRYYSSGIDGVLVAEDPDGKEIFRVTLPASVCAIAVLEGNAVAAGLANGSIALVEGGILKAVAAAHSAGTAALATGPDRALYSVGGDGVLRAWRSSPGHLEPVGRVDPPVLPAGTPARSRALGAVAVAPDGHAAATAGADGVVRVYSIPDLSETRAFRGHEGWVTGLTFTADGRALFSAGADKSVRRFEMPRVTTASGHAGPVTAVAVSPDGQLFATGSADRSAKVWDRTTGKLLATLPGPSVIGGVGFITPGELVTGGQDGVVRWWDWKAGKELRSASLPTPGRIIFGLAANGETGQVAVVWGEANGQLAGANRFTADAKPTGEITQRGELVAAALSGDAARVAFATGDGVRVADIKPPQGEIPPWLLFANGVVDVALSRDGSTLVGIGGDGGRAVDGTESGVAAKVAQTATREAGERIKTGPAAGLAAAPNGDRFLTFDTQGGVQLFDRAGKRLRTWKLTSAVRTAAVSPDGKTAITAHRDGTATVLELGE